MLPTAQVCDAADGHCLTVEDKALDKHVVIQQAPSAPSVTEPAKPHRMAVTVHLEAVQVVLVMSQSSRICCGCQACQSLWCRSVTSHTPQQGAVRPLQASEAAESHLCTTPGREAQACAIMQVSWWDDVGRLAAHQQAASTHVARQEHPHAVEVAGLRLEQLHLAATLQTHGEPACSEQ